MKQFRFAVAAIAALVLGACAQQPIRQDAGATPAPVPKQPPTQQSAPIKPKVVISRPEPRKPALPEVQLTEQLMFRIMLAEVALQRGQPHVAVPAYLELARETMDPRVAQRATEVAWNARFVSAALEAAGLWLQTDPASGRARQVLAALLVNQSRIAEAQPHLEKWLTTDKARVGQSFLQLSSLIGRHKDRIGVLRLMQALAKPYPALPEARLAVAQAAWNAGEGELAVEESRAALDLQPGWEVAALFHAQVLRQQRSGAAAVAFLGQYLKEHDQAREVRLNYARLLVAEKRYGEARQQFEVLLAAHPEDAEVAMAVALLAMQFNDMPAAEVQLKRALDLGYKDPDTARYYLGQLSEEARRLDEALKWYEGVGEGGRYVSAQSRYAGVLVKQGRLDAARKHLQQAAAASGGAQRIQFVQAEAALLREAGRYKEAFAVLSAALEQNPAAPDLLYDHAMAAEKVDRVDILEVSLRKLIELRPDHAHAYNALGYTLADRNQRLDEARGLIETALKLAPDDPFIIDSMGWVLYRLGHLKEALVHLQRAHGLRPDAEIAAHLGELLWANGRQDEAQRVWSEALATHPANDVLQNTIKRFAPVILPAAR